MKLLTKEHVRFGPDFKNLVNQQDKKNDDEGALQLNAKFKM